MVWGGGGKGGGGRGGFGGGGGGGGGESRRAKLSATGDVGREGAVERRWKGVARGTQLGD